MSKKYENIFEYLEVFDPEDDPLDDWDPYVECRYCGSTSSPHYGPARELTNPHCRSGWWVTVCRDCGEVLDMHL